MTIINICFFDGTSEMAKTIAKGLNNHANIDRTLILTEENIELDTLMNFAGEERVFEQIEFDEKGLSIIDFLKVELQRIMREYENVEFLINLSTADSMKAFTCYPIAVLFKAEIYLIDGYSIPITDFPDMNQLNDVKINILRMLDKELMMTTIQIEKNGKYVKYRRMRQILKELKESNYIQVVDYDSIDNQMKRKLFPEEKRGPKGEIFKLTEKGKLACGYVITDRVA